MHNRARGILQWERTHKAIVPICYEEQKKHLFDFVVLLWDLKEGLINTANMIKQLQDEDNDGIQVIRQTSSASRTSDDLMGYSW
ncbi:6113_t:CDS:2 [Ambispora gerdemannii]|uniref:6113_t:CDS:1 n=1 Tax=Ambispora gerdemannii TaxID=144530 RepID=A0A9N9CBL5_9GLOM|nr:6113_t:CDS:2 [Ambispora gerdemannii]